jgi:membrane-bound ClpP family serine protease
LLPRASRFRGLVLDTALVGAGGRRTSDAAAPDSAVTPRAGRTPAEHPSLIGARGRAVSDLRPGGFALIDGRRVDVVTQGDYIPAGEPVEIILDEGYRRVVRRLTSGPA